MIAVGATRYDDTRAAYSQYGSGLEVMSPGGDINVDQNGDDLVDGILQETFTGYDRVSGVLPDPTDFGLWLYSGTSMAAPHVTALCAMMIAIILQVDDRSNDPVSSDITVVINDTGVPTLAPKANKTILWPPNHEMVDIVIEANASDKSGGQVYLSATVSSNELEDGLGDGDMAPDWTEPVIDPSSGIITFQLRAERSGSGDGRIYTITITATDDSGNTSLAGVEIIVPHDKRKK